jgi:hypothetical protein
MRYCTNCGSKLGVGRYCTNCGARVPVAPTDVPARPDDYPTNSRIAPVPATPTPDAPATPPPPALGPEPSSARYPLYAETVQEYPVGAPLADAATYDISTARRRPVLPWVIALVGLAVIALIGGGLLLLGSSGDDDPARSAELADADGDDRDDRQSVEDPDSAPNSELVPADVEVPDVAPASVDEDGNRVTYTASNMLDADPRTCWRMAGDGSGSILSFTFDGPVTINEIGLINGYAKTDPPHNWYDGNRRIDRVLWTFDDGTELTQELSDDTALQTVPVDAVETTSVELRILEVTEPGTGPDARDFTAISDVAISGS